MTVIKKKKCKSNTPIIFAVPKSVQDQIKRVPRLSLQAFKDNTQTPTDWYNIAFRIKIGLGIAESTYTDDAIIPMKEVLQVCLDIKDRYLETKVMSATIEECEAIEIGIDATDEMTDQTTRRIQLDAFHASDKFMKSILVEVNKDIPR